MKNKGQSDNLWGIDLGGTKIEGVVLQSANTPEVLVRHRVLTESHLGYQHVIQQIVSLVDNLKTEMGYPPQHIGIGTPGILDPTTNLMKNCNSTCLNGMPLRADLEKLLKVKIAMANDANCFALAETTLGIVKDKCKDSKIVFGVIIGTGVGGGLVIDNKIIQGLHGIGGEWGHNFLDESGGPCYCGRVGCVETILSGPALEKYYHSISGSELSLPSIWDAHIKRIDEDASRTIERLTEYFGRAISVVVNIVDPDVIVVGGGVGNIDAIYQEGVKSLERFIFNDYLKTQVLKPKLGDSAGVFGAAFLAVKK